MINNNEDLILALMEDEIEPTDKAVAQLSVQVDELARLLVEVYIDKTVRDKTKLNAIVGLVAKLRQLAEHKTGSRRAPTLPPRSPEVAGNSKNESSL